jgi:GntR family transcriptional regulator, transcriptional repressor for pyruvate dehydrogenase complex
METIQENQHPDRNASHSVKEMLSGLHDLDSTRKAERIVPILIKYIHESGLDPGDKLPSEKQLCEDIGVGRRALRESLICLQSVGLIQSQHGTGWFLNRFDPASSLRFLSPLLQNFSNADILQVMQTRLAIEPMIAQLATQNVSPNGLKELSQSVQDLQNTADQPVLNIEDFRIHDRTFHNILALECGNIVLSMISSILTGLFYSAIWSLPQENIPIIIEQHRAILNAIQEGNSQLALTTTANHLQEAINSITRHPQRNF